MFEHNIRFYMTYIKDRYIPKYTKSDLKWTGIYCSLGATLAAATNSYANFIDGSGDLLGAFGRGFRNHIPIAAVVSLFYAKTVNKLCTSEHPRLYSNMLSIGITAVVISVHNIAGTDNPIRASLPGCILGIALTNVQVSKETKALEETINENTKPL